MPWSRVNTEYSIQRVQHTPSTAYTAYCSIPRLTVSHSQPVSQLSVDHVVLNSLHSHDYKLTNGSSLSFRCTSLLIYRLQINLLQVLQSRSIMACKYISKLARSRPPSVSLRYTISASKCISVLHNLGLQVHLWVTQSRPPSASPNSLNHGLQVHSLSLISSRPPSASPNLLYHGIKVHLLVTRSQPLSASPNWLDHGAQVHLWVQLDLGLQVHLQSCSIMTSMCISELLDLGLRMHLRTPSSTASKCITEFNLISASKCISKLTPSRPRSTFPSSHDHGLQVHL